MASAQVKPSSRRQDDAEAGRRKLEQFRKQKAAERAKKASQGNSTQPVDKSQQSVTDSDGTVASMSNGPLKQSSETHQVSSYETHAKSSSSADVYSLSFSNLATNDGSKERSQKVDGQESVGTVDFTSSLELIGSTKDLTVNNRPEVVPYSHIDKQSSENIDRASTLRQSDGVLKGRSPFYGSTLLSTSTQMDGFINGSGLISSRKDSLQPTTRMAGSIHEVAKNQQGSGELRGVSIVQKPTLSSSYLFSSPDTSFRLSESSDFSVNSTSSSQFHTAKNEASVKRSRPSFLDSLNISRGPETQYQHPDIEADSVTSSGYQLTGSDGFGPYSLQHISGKRDSNGPPLTGAVSGSPSPFQSSLFPTANGVIPGFHDFSMPKRNDDFTALEQHIEDLTQEKFSLQRDLDASRALAESLASENSSITETYNQQRSIVNQLKDDMEKLHQQILAQMGELESVRIEYANAQLECNAADERSQILASEVISLEDKALRLRSNELKLERQLENAQAEMSSYKKKLQSLEKDRQDLQSTIKALQEEKKILQTMLQKASSGGKSTDLGKSSSSRKNASTSTEDLVILDTLPESSNQETDSTALLEIDSSNTFIIPETGPLTLEGFPLSVPADQIRLIHNINTLIAELAIEKEELVQALSSELSRSAHVKELNKELLRKLEMQTQRLELLTAQNMAIDNVSPAKQSDSHVVQERTPIADEGDEVVERVLGWIMKMFPGGPSKRRTSKLL